MYIFFIQIQNTTYTNTYKTIKLITLQKHINVSINRSKN